MSGEAGDLLMKADEEIALQSPVDPAEDSKVPEEHHRTSCFEYRAHIDGLRAVAVISVIIYHMNQQWLPGGYTGVDVFFVISGYVVAGSLFNHIANHPEEGAKDFLLAFYERRIKRLAPALVLAVSITAIATAMLVPAAMHVEDAYEAGIGALCGYANMYFTWQSTLGAPSYFDQMTGEMRVKANPLMHMWSLGVEEQFYFVAPAVILLVRGARGTAVPSLAVLLAGCCISLLGCWLATDLFQPFAFYNMPARLWELAAGVAAADMETFGMGTWAPLGWNGGGAEGAAAGSWSPSWPQFRLPSGPSAGVAAAALDAAAAGLLATSFVAVTPDRMNFPFPGAVLPVAAALGVIALGRFESSVVGRFLRLPPMVYVGKISYPAYLWHWPILVLSRQTAIVGLPVPARVAVQSALILAFAAMTYRWVEGGVRDWRPQQPWSVVRTFVPINAVAVCLLLALRFGPSDKLYIGTLLRGQGRMMMDSPLLQLVSVPEDKCACSGVPDFLHQPPGAQKDNADLPSCLVTGNDGVPEELLAPYLERGVVSRDPGMCFLSTGNFGGPETNCLEKTPDSNKPTLYLLGDSHAIGYAPGVFRAVGSVMEVKSQSRVAHCSCMLEHLEDSLKELDPSVSIDREACDSLFKFVNSSVQASDVVMLANELTCVPKDQVASVTGYLRKLAAVVKSKGAKMIVLGDWEHMTEAPGCMFTQVYEEIGEGPCWLTPDSNTPSRILEKAIAKEAATSDFLFFPVRELFCDKDGCGPYYPGTREFAYADFSHVSWDGASYLAPFLCSFLRTHGIAHGLL